MGSMRQRLLLVAGWAAAAVVASLVSTGAVAVAGGQVTDQPLRPLSASEVAALTVECGSSERAPCLRQLDDSVDPQPTVAAAPTTNSSLEGDEQGVSPLPSSDLAPDGQQETADDNLLPPRDSEPEPQATIVEFEGGRASISGADGEVFVIWAIPKPGFALLPSTGTRQSAATRTLVFSDGTRESTVVASWDAEEGLMVETSTRSR
jgi:hypothetical protein